MRKIDWADREAERLYDMVRDGADDLAVIEAIGDALRAAKGTEKPPSLPTASRKLCMIPARTLPPCDLEWGHDGDMHVNAGDGFYARDRDEEHHRRQKERRAIGAAGKALER